MSDSSCESEDCSIGCLALKIKSAVRHKSLLLLHISVRSACNLSTGAILWGQVLRAILPYLLYLMAVALPHILGGTYVIESVFNYPGIGRLAVESAKNHDYAVLQAIVLLTGVVAIGAGLAAKLLCLTLDKRWKHRTEEQW